MQQNSTVHSWCNAVLYCILCGRFDCIALYCIAFYVGASMGKLRRPVVTPDSCLTATRPSAPSAPACEKPNPPRAHSLAGSFPASGSGYWGMNEYSLCVCVCPPTASYPRCRSPPHIRAHFLPKYLALKRRCVQ